MELAALTTVGSTTRPSLSEVASRFAASKLTRIKRNIPTGAEWVEVELDDEGRPENQ